MFQVKTNFGFKNFWSQKILVLKKLDLQKEFCVKNICSNKKCRQNFFLISKKVWSINMHMGGFDQPQQKYAGTSENRIITISAVFYPVNKTLRKLACILLGFISTQILKVGLKRCKQRNVGLLSKYNKPRWQANHQLSTSFHQLQLAMANSAISSWIKRLKKTLG